MKRIRVFASMLTAAIVICLAPPAEAAGSSCSGYIGGSKTINFNAFAGHKIRATYQWCNPGKTGAMGPVQTQYLRGVTTPKISFPTRVPTGLGEKVTLSEKPYLYSWSKTQAKFRFSVHQGHVAVPVSSDYDFEIRVYAGGKGKICFVGRSCSSLQ